MIRTILLLLFFALGLSELLADELLDDSGINRGQSYVNNIHPTVLTTNPPIEMNGAQRLMRMLNLKRGENIVRPRRNATKKVSVRFKMELYQIIDLSERQQYVKVSAWIIERWYDEFLYWNPDEYDNITDVKVPWTFIWVPDTVLYNTVVMKDDDQRRLMYAKLSTENDKRRAYVEFLYPAIFTFSCKLYLKFFPYDVQTCHMIFGSWTSDNMDIDYEPYAEEVGTSNYLTNEGWTLMGTQVERREVKYVCCPNNYTLLDFTLFLKRKPLFYLVNLVIPTFIITLIAITGFFTTSSTTEVREEKISLCITTLLSMSILMLMVSDQMPSTSTNIPLISWFYMCAIVIISGGALAAAFVISVQKFGRQGERLPPNAVKVGVWFSKWSLTRLPAHLKPKTMLMKEHYRFGNSKDESRKSTIVQFAKYFFSAGSEIATYPLGDYANNNQPLLEKLGSDVESTTRKTNISNGSSDLHSARTRAISAAVNETEAEENGFVSALPKVSNSSSSSCHEEVKKILHNYRIRRELSKIEYDWLATVIERCTFIFFVLLFVTVSFGINVVGIIHWLNATPPSYAIPAERD